jgi:hypothetical protein
MFNEADAPMRVTGNAQLGGGIFSFSESRGALSPLEVRMIRLELRLADLEARTLPARWHRLVLWVDHYWRRIAEPTAARTRQLRQILRELLWR